MTQRVDDKFDRHDALDSGLLQVQRILRSYTQRIANHWAIEFGFDVDTLGGTEIGDLLYRARRSGGRQPFACAGSRLESESPERR